MVPIPGLDWAVDAALLSRLIPQINARFGLTPEQMARLGPSQRDQVQKAISGVGSVLIGKFISKELVLRAAQTVGMRLTTAQAAVLGKANWREMAAMPWIASPPRSHVRAIQNMMFANQGVVPNIVIECDQLSAIGGMVRSGLGLAVMREEAAIELAEGGELFIWPHVTTPSQLMFVFRASEESNPSTIGMISVLKDCWGI